MSDPVEALCDLGVLALLRGVLLEGFQTARFVDVVLNPDLNAFDHQLDGLVVVEAVHADQAVTAGQAGNFRLALFADGDNAVEAVLQRVEVVHHFAALRQCVAGIELADHVAHESFLHRVLGNHALILAAVVVNRLVDPLVGDLQRSGNFFLPHAELARQRNHRAKILGHIAAAGAVF